MIKVEITFFVNVLFHFIRLCFVHKLKKQIIKVIYLHFIVFFKCIIWWSKSTLSF